MAMRRKTLSEQLLDAIEASGVSNYRLSKETGVSEPALSRFRRGLTVLSMPAAEAIAAYLGLRLVGPEPKPARGMKATQKKRRAKR